MLARLPSLYSIHPILSYPPENSKSHEDENKDLLYFTLPPSRIEWDGSR